MFQKWDSEEEMTRSVSYTLGDAYLGGAVQEQIDAANDAIRTINEWIGPLPAAGRRRPVRR